MRIEAQAKYLQKIIEEQQKLGGESKDSDVLPSTEDNKQKTCQSESYDVSAGPSSPRKKQRVDRVSTDDSAPSINLP